MMRQLVSILAVTVAICVSTASAQYPWLQGITWSEDLVASYQQAMKDKVPMVLYVYGDDGDAPAGTKCKWCLKLEQGAFASPEFAAYSKRAVFVKVDYNRADQQAAKMLKSLNIDQIPTVVLLHCQADIIQEVGRVTGHFVMPTYIERFAKPFEDCVKQIAQTQGGGFTDNRPAEPVRPNLEQQPQRSNEVLIARSAMEKLQAFLGQLSTTEKTYLADLHELANNNVYNPGKFAEDYIAVTRAFASLYSHLEEIERLGSPEAKEFAQCVRELTVWYNQTYAASYLEVTSTAGQTGIDGRNVGQATAAKFVTTFQQREQSEESQRGAKKLTAAGEAFARRYFQK